MTIEVEVVATETIKPSSQTPPHLKTFPLSGLDQFCPPVDSPFFLCYTSKDNHQKDKWIHTLKQSLAETLTYIYPLGGRINDNKHITCNDEGIHLFEARVHGYTLSQFLSGNPQPEELEKLLPKEDLLVLGTKALLSVQLNFFQGGGMVLALLISHKLADAFSIYLFLNCWASIARGDGEETHPPKLGTSSTFPPNNIPAFVLPHGNSAEKMVSKRFVFSTVNIAAVRSDLFTKPLSRAAAVTALIWKCAMNAGISEMKSVATFSVNLRGNKQLPHLSKSCIGNCYVCTTTTTTERHAELTDLLDKLREARRRVDSDYLKQLKAGDPVFLEPFKEANERCSKGELKRYSFATLCNYPFYDTDFGWGKPTWVTSTAGVGYKNVVVLMDTKCGSGVEVWVTLDEESMASFERHPDLVAFTSPNTIALRSNM